MSVPLEGFEGLGCKTFLDFISAAISAPRQIPFPAPPPDPPCPLDIAQSRLTIPSTPPLSSIHRLGKIGCEETVDDPRRVRVKALAAGAREKEQQSRGSVSAMRGTAIDRMPCHQTEKTQVTAPNDLTA